jgi:hypothetical protein
MNPAMNVRGQHEMHPDAETLSAFTEQALNAHERSEVLAHLAVCSRCRQVVALAREAAGAEVAAARHEVVQPRAWWRSWGLALVPAAALAATAVIAFYVHERAVERTAEVAKLEQQQANEKVAMPLQTLPPRTDVVLPTPSAPVDAQGKPDAPTKLRETERPGGTRRKPASLPDETAAAPPAAPAPEALNGPAPERERYRRSPAAEIHGAMENAYAPTQALVDDKTPSEAAMDREERKKQADEAEDERHQFAAKAATPTNPHDSKIDKAGIDNADNGGNGSARSSTVASSEQVEVDAQQLETQPAPEVTAGSLMRMRSGAFSSAITERPIHLPSGLPALSIASSDRRLLAIDKKGALFFSDDSGLAWEKVKRQWTGRAILVRRKTAEDATPPTATAPESAGKTADSLSQPESVFELVNDQSELWLSADGRIWTAK